MPNKALYFVALVPPPAVFDEVNKMKHQVAEVYQSKAALRSPPHITLHMPFRYREDREEGIKDVLWHLAKQFAPFEMQHDGFGCFSPRVIYVNVDLTNSLSELRKQLVLEMRQKLNLENADYKDRAFHPHMTIAYRDLRKKAFFEAWEFYQSQSFQASWLCSAITLLKHNGASWDIHSNHELSA